MDVHIRQQLPSIKFPGLVLSVLVSAASLLPHVAVAVPVMAWISHLFYVGIVTLIFHTLFPMICLGLP